LHPVGLQGITNQRKDPPEKHNSKLYLEQKKTSLEKKHEGHNDREEEGEGSLGGGRSTQQTKKKSGMEGVLEYKAQSGGFKKKS